MSSGSASSETFSAFEILISFLSDAGIVSKPELTSALGQLSSDKTLKTLETLSAEMLAAGQLTEFQVETICQGHACDLVLGDYLLTDVIGHGGMGRVYRARHVLMKRDVAVKLLQPNIATLVESVQRFKREVRAAAKLIHANIVTALDAGVKEGHYYLVMEYVNGQDLGRIVRSQGPRSLKQALDYCIQTADGLRYAHGEGIVHRDVKPGNLLVTETGNVKILDLGLSRMQPSLRALEAGEQEREESLTNSGEIMGTIAFMAPEQALDPKNIDHRVDIYSLGCTLYFLMTGSAPYRGKSVVRRLLAHRDEPIPPLGEIRAGVPDRLENVYRKMMAKDPADRCQSMSEVLRELRLCLAHVDTAEPGLQDTLVAQPNGEPSAAGRAALRRRWWLAAASGFVLVVAVIYAAVSFTGRPQQGADTSPEGPVALMMISESTDLLAHLDPARDVISGEGWKLTDGVLTTSLGTPAKLQVPVHVPGAYELELDVTRVDGHGPLVIGLVAAEQQCYVLLDKRKNPQNPGASGLGTDSQNKLVATNTLVRFDTGERSTIRCIVGPSRIRVSVNEKSVIDWEGDPRDLSLPPAYKVPDAQALFIGTNDAVFDISRLLIVPTSESTPKPTDERPQVAPVDPGSE